MTKRTYQRKPKPQLPDPITRDQAAMQRIFQLFLTSGAQVLGDTFAFTPDQRGKWALLTKAQIQEYLGVKE